MLARCVWKSTLVLLIWASWYGPCVFVVVGNEAIVPNPATQSKINELATAVREARGREGDERVAKALLDLNRVAGHDAVDLVRQLIWHTAHASPKQAEGMAMPLAMEHLPISRTAMVEAVAPLLGKTGDARLEEAIAEVVNYIAPYCWDEGWDLSYFQAYVEGRLRTKRDVDSGFVAMMFHRSPGQALQTFAAVVYQDERRKPFLWARHVVDDLLWRRKYGFSPPKEQDPAVTRELEKMAAHDEWWARLYAAEVIRQSPELGTRAIVERLARDPNALVRETAKKIGSS